MQNSTSAAQPAEGGGPTLAKATFAGGCFWCTEAVYAQIKGVTSVTSWSIGGQVPNPTYKDGACGGCGNHLRPGRRSL